MQQQQQQDISNAILIGLSTLSDPDIKISSKDIEALAVFKGILRAIINGELILATPDRVIPERIAKSSPEEETKGDE